MKKTQEEIKLTTEIHRLQTINAELLEALEAIAEEAYGTDVFDMTDQEAALYWGKLTIKCRKLARAAIAKAKE